MALSRPGEWSAPPALATATMAWSGVVGIVALHLVALVAVDETAGLAALVALESVLTVSVAAVEAGPGPGSPRDGGVLLGTWAALAGGTWLAAGSVGLPVVALGLVVVVGLAVYALHRYELVALGLVEVADERE